MWGAALFRTTAPLVIAFVATFDIARADTDLVKRGDYLVNGILTCGNCHTPQSASGDTDIAGRHFPAVGAGTSRRSK
jgi:hypothetical protein